MDIAQVSDLKIRMHDNIAVLTGAYHEKGVFGEKPYDYHDRMTDVWMKIAGKMATHRFALQAAG